MMNIIKKMFIKDYMNKILNTTKEKNKKWKKI